MTNRAVNKDYVTAFEAALDAQLAQNSVTAASVARAIGVSPALMSRFRNGSRRVSPQWIDIIADTLRATEEERQKLHRAAARDRGYKV